MWRNILNDHSPAAEGVKQMADVVSAGVAVGSLLGVLPAIAALFTIIWTAIRIWESETVQSLIYGKRDED